MTTRVEIARRRVSVALGRVAAARIQHEKALRLLDEFLVADMKKRGIVPGQTPLLAWGEDGSPLEGRYTLLFVRDGTIRLTLIQDDHAAYRFATRVEVAP